MRYRLYARQCAFVVMLSALAGILIGCGGIGDQSTEEPEAGVVVVGVLDAETEDFLPVDASVVVGGVRGIATVAEGSVVLRDVPFGTSTPPTQPLTVTARGYRTIGYPIVISVSQATFETAELESVDLAKTGIIEGHVTDSDTGLPVVSALISFEYEQLGEDPVIVNGYTDNTGYYLIGGVPIGRVTVTATATNYISESVIANIAQADGAAGPQLLDLSLLAGETKVTLQGRVEDVLTQAPIAGATIKLDGVVRGSSDENGQFSIADVFVGERALIVVAEGYDVYRENIEVLPGMQQVVVQMNEAASEPPSKPYTICGTVTLIGAADNSGATVEAFDTVNAFVAATATTDATGNYSLFVPAGTYQITVQYGGKQISRTVVLPGGGQKLSGINFTLTVS